MTNDSTKIFWSVSGKKCLESQQKKEPRIDFGDHYFVQITILIPDTTGKSSLERYHPLLTEFLILMNSCFVQYNEQLEKLVNVLQ